MQSALGWSATDFGLSLMVLMVSLNVSAGLSSQLLGRVKHYKIVPSLCLVIGIAAVLTLAFSASAMTSLKFEIILLLIGLGFGPTSPLTQVALQNTVANHHLGTAIGTMNFARTLLGTILVAGFGAVVLAGVPVEAPADTLGGYIFTATSVKAFTEVFLAAAGTMTVAFMALLLLEEKPLLATLPAAPP